MRISGGRSPARTQTNLWNLDREWVLTSQSMRSLVASLTLGAVLVFILAPSVVDGEAHCLGHQAAATVTSPEKADGRHGVHHADCYWLKGQSNTRAVLLHGTPPVGLTCYAPWVSPIPAISHPVDLPAFSGRSPPPLPLRSRV